MGRRSLCAFISLLSLLAPPVRGQESLKIGQRAYVKVGQCDRPSYNVKLFLAPVAEQPTQKALSVVFGADADGNGYRFEADGRNWTLSDMAGGRARRIAAGRTSPLPTGDEVELLIKRRDWLLTVAANGRVLAEVADASHFGGSVWLDPSRSAPARADGAIKLPIVQVVGDLEFREEFMRPQEELDVSTLTNWSVARGVWKLHSVREDSDDMDWSKRPENKHPQSERSANPFSMSGHADTSALIVTKGHWFWDDYRASTAISNTGAEAVGLAFNVVAADDYFLLRWSQWRPVRGATCIRLLRVRGGKTVELGRAWVQGQLGQWYRLAVETCGQRIRAYVDEAEVLDVRHPESIGGEIGLYVAGGDDEKAGMFDDIELNSTRGYDYDDKVWLAGYLNSPEGKWSYSKIERPARPDNHGAVLRSADGRVTIGHGAWAPPLIQARLSIPALGQEIGFGAGLGSDSGEAYRALLTRDNGGPRLDLVHLAADESTVVASCRDFDLAAKGLVDLSLDLTRPGECNVFLDGRLRLHAPRAGSGGGAVAFFARAFRGAEFRDLRVAFQRTEDTEKLPERDIFATDPFMKHWSSPEGAWWPVEGTATSWRHVGDFFGRSDIEVPFNPTFAVIHCAESTATTSGYALTQQAVPGDDGKQHYKLTLLRQGTPVASADVVPPPPKAPEGEGKQPLPPRLVFHKDTPYLWVSVDGKEVLSFRDPEPLKGTHVALSGVRKEQLSLLDVHRTHVRDEYFEAAATEWYRVGLWKVVNRFACDPRWSFMAGLATQNAVLFNKYRYEGDVTVEAYMGMRMDSRGRGTYVRVGDFNFALCQRPLQLDSGYNFVVAGWDRQISDSKSYLLKGLEELAASTERVLPNVRHKGMAQRVLPVPWISSGRPIHGAWYYIKARKQGNELSSYVDNHQVYSVKDDAPLTSFTPAVWTYNADIVVARVKVSYQKRIVPGRLVDPPPAANEPKAPEAPAPIIASSTHPGFADDFEGGLRGWTTYKQQSGHLEIAGSSRRGGGACLRVTNPGAGGLFEAIAPVRDAAIQIQDVERFGFDYRLDPGVRLNLYLKVDTQYYYVHMNGPDEPSPFYLRLGELPVQDDGQWHRAEFPLGGAFRNLGAGGRLVTLAIGNLHRGQLQMGLGGNGPGLTYCLDNIEIASAGPAAFRAGLRAPDRPAGATVLYAVDRKDGTVPNATDPPNVPLKESGRWVCHARVKFEDGYLGPVAHMPFIVADAPATLTAISPKDGEQWPCGPITLKMGPADGARLKPETLSVRVNGWTVPSYKDLVDIDWARGTVKIDLRGAGLHVTDGQAITVVVGYSDERGRAGSCQTKHTVALAADRTPPTRVVLEGYRPTDDFEDGLASWTADEGTALMRDFATAASGRWSLMVQNHRWRGTFAAYPLRDQISLGTYPIVEFDYRIDEGATVDLAANHVRGQLVMGLSDKSRHGHYLGEADGLRIDGQWHHAEFNLLDSVKKLGHHRYLYNCSNLGFADLDYRLAALGAYYRIDNFRLVPLVSGAGGLALKWGSQDAGGIAGYSYKWSDARVDAPDDEIDTDSPEAVFSTLPGPDAWFHIKARDKAGNWGPVESFRFRVDSTPPRMAGATPGRDEKAAPQDVRITVRDAESAIDPETLKVTIDGAAYTPESRGVTYDPASGSYVWNWLAARPRNVRSIPNGKKIAVTVRAKDFAGNELEPQDWSWVMDYSTDKTPPAAPEISCSSVAIRSLETFADRNSQWQPVADGRSTEAQLRYVERDGAGKDFCLELVAQRRNRPCLVSACRFRYDLKQYPHLSFECSIPDATKVNMQVQINNRWHEIQLNGEKLAHPSLGAAEFKAGGGWQRISLDLLAMATKALPGQRNLTVTAITFGNPGGNPLPASSTWRVDNFLISSFGKPEAAFTWKTDDITGIKGYAGTFDRSPDTEPAPKIASTKEAGTFNATVPGVYWLHVRAVDGNGNWGPTSHFIYPVAGTEEAPPAT